MSRGVFFLLGVLGTVACGSSADDGPAAPVPAVDAGGAAILNVTAHACSCDSECATIGENAGVCVYGVCMAKPKAECSAPGSTDECPAGTRCWSLRGEGICFPDCGDGKECAGTCDRDGSCVHAPTTNCDSSCASFCKTDERLCSEKVPNGKCPAGAACVAGSCISKGCPDWHCEGSGCTDLISMPGPTKEKDPEAEALGYFVASDPKYAFLRKDLTMLAQYAACEVRYKFPDTKPLGLADLSQKDGKTPGVDIGRPRHATSTHQGDDLDIAYYQTDGANEPQIICGDGSDENPNGMAGKYNDGFFCTSRENIIDWPRELWLFAKFSESPKVRVFGIDQTLPKSFIDGAGKLRRDGEINADVAERMTHVGYGNQGGWAFHHHHSHMSFYR